MALKKCYKKNILEVGCDESGRGAIAGPVVAAAVLFPSSFYHSSIIDSKKMSHLQREKMELIIKVNSIQFGIGCVYPKEIDSINILKASISAMHKALDCISKNFYHIIVDGNHFNSYKNTPYCCFIKGDDKYLSIAAASILAKTQRDKYMCKLHREYPNYHWDKNKGYPTKKHREAILKYGITPHHRKSFKLV